MYVQNKNKSKLTPPVAKTSLGHAVWLGSSVKGERGGVFIILGREGNIMIVRPLMGASVLPPSVWGTVPTQRVHPIQLGLRSNVTLPSYVTR